MDRAKISNRIEINASGEKVFAYIINPLNVLNVLPGLMKAENITDNPFKTGSSYDFTFKMYGVELAGKWIVDDIHSPSLYIGHSIGEAESWWTQEVISDGDKSTLSIIIEYNIPKTLMSEIKVMGLMAINRNQINTYLANVKDILETK